MEPQPSTTPPRLTVTRSRGLDRLLGFVLGLGVWAAAWGLWYVIRPYDEFEFIAYAISIFLTAFGLLIFRKRSGTIMLFLTLTAVGLPFLAFLALMGMCMKTGV